MVPNLLFHASVLATVAAVSGGEAVKLCRSGIDSLSNLGKTAVYGGMALLAMGGVVKHGYHGVVGTAVAGVERPQAQIPAAVSNLNRS